MGEIYAEIFLYYQYTFFFNAPTGQTPQGIFTCDSSNDTASRNVQTFQG